MKRAFIKIGLICTVLVFIPFIFSLPLQFNQQKLQKSNDPNKYKSFHNREEEIFKALNWIGPGDCWDFANRIFIAVISQRFISRNLWHCAPGLKLLNMTRSDHEIWIEKRYHQKDLHCS